MSAHSCLVLTTDMVPHKIQEWHAAVTSVLSGKAYVLSEYEETISAPSLTMNLPAVVQLKKKFVRNKKNPVFSRSNVYEFFSYRCAYCAKKCTAKELTYDHVLPSSRGGLTNWSGVVAACYPCNSKKRNRTPEEAGMKLLQRPKVPTTAIHTVLALPRNVPEEWVVFLEGHRTMRLVG